MNTQIANLPLAVAVGASVYLAPKIDRGAVIPNINYFQLVGWENSNMTSMVGLLFPSTDIATMEEINVVESNDNNSEQAALEKKFKGLAQKWKAQTGGSSSITSMVMNPAYLEIISYGEKMIPFILKDLNNKPGHWFIALRILARTSPVKPEDAGNIKKMTEAWLSWGRENGKFS